MTCPVEDIKRRAAATPKHAATVLSAGLVSRGDLLFVGGYPVEMVHKRVSPDGSMCTLIWGEGANDQTTMSAGTDIRVVLAPAYGTPAL